MDVTSQRKTNPRSITFQKMERIVKAMQHPENGVPVRSQKLFLTTVPNAFTGNDIAEWMMNKLNIKDITEALHLATLLCNYGYFFHVTTNGTIQIKEDNELFRFQRALDDLKKKLLHQWDFITMQAESQFRVLKDRKKTDKTIIDSQERAFWHVMRPSPDETSVLDMDIRNDLYTYRPIKREDAIKRRLEYLQQALSNRVRTKASQTHQSLCAFFEIFSDYDPFLGHCQPSNPWITDDTLMWDVLTPLVDNPTQLRVRRWSFNVKELLRDPTGVREFQKFCVSEFSTESLNFYLHVQEIRRCPLSQVKQKAETLYREHLAPNAPHEVNINDMIRSKIVKQMTNPTRDIFIEAERHIIELIKKNSYSRFIQSEYYRQLLMNAPNPMPKKTGIFHFVKDTYFRTSDSSSSDYDSDESGEQHHNNNALVGGREKEAKQQHAMVTSASGQVAATATTVTPNVVTNVEVTRPTSGAGKFHHR
ncbi:unnamed protein product [Didymodactylos carnosus]|uniref:Regulator of G-protein signaling 7 n=1 Tax=Didymodactylos carnosus TaxID=1234261 RepID=A0A813QVL2_9BILA|nr:unnamed protein product [Didymodactylos carnosus]CAF3554393.1 unnamed protein product [Didymodactylos carnosus]